MFELSSGLRDPGGNVSEAAAEFAKAAAPVVLGVSEKLMGNVYETTKLSGSKFLQEHPIRDCNGNIVLNEDEKPKNENEEVDVYGVIKSQGQTQNNSGYNSGRTRR